MTLPEALLRFLVASVVWSAAFGVVYQVTLAVLGWQDRRRAVGLCESCRRRRWSRVVAVDGGFFLVCQDCAPEKGEQPCP